MKKRNNLHQAGFRNRLLVVLSLVMVGSALTACAQTDTGESTLEMPSEELATTSVPAETEQTQETFLELPLTGYELKTPVGTIVYPEEWEDRLEVEEKSDGETYTAEFRCILSEEKVPLFSLSVGPQGIGYQLGDLDGTPVWIDVSPVERKPDWSDEDAAQITEMQNRVNDILDQIYHLEGFRAAEPPRK